jgi:3,4-dihydroxy 2-butanone 4-phosphate synthase/GTP cyclohydrolase II
MPVSSIENALEDVRQSRMIILVDDGDRENEGNLVLAAEKVTPEVINFMAMYGRGLICLALSPEIVEKLKLPLMVYDNHPSFQAAFTVSVEARQGVSTGISAADRAHTILTAVADDARPEDLIQPGHVFPLRARKGGVLVNTSKTEGAVDLAYLAGLKPAAVTCGIMSEDGTMAKMSDLEKFVEEHGLNIVTVADIISYKMRRESFVRKVVETILPTPYGEFKAIAFVNELNNYEHLALVKGEIDPEEEILVRVHPQCLVGDVFGSYRCDCREKLDKAMAMIQRAGRGVILYLQKEGRGIKVSSKLKTFELQDMVPDQVDADEERGFELRDFGVGAQIMVALGVRKMRVITDRYPSKIVGLEGYGFEVIETVPIATVPLQKN